MMILITGGSKCGKSAAAEAILDGFEGDKFYIAAMEPFGDEAQKAIERHRVMRQGKGFITIERSHNIDTLVMPYESTGLCALLECLTTLCANEMFTQEEITDPSKKILGGLKSLSEQVEKLVVVTNEVASDGLEYPSGTTEYIRIMSQLNNAAAQFADVVIECVCGIPLLLKGTI